MKIRVKLEPNELSEYKTFDLEDLGITESEWNKLPDSQNKDLLEKQVFDLPEQPYWCLDDFSEI